MKNNKMIKCLSALLVISLLACGCGKEIEVKNGSKVAVSAKGSKITATEYYEKIKTENISKLVDMIDHDLFDEKYKDNTEEDTKVNNQLEIYNYKIDKEDEFTKEEKELFIIAEDIISKIKNKYQQ